MHPVYIKSLTQKQRRAHWQCIIADWRNSGLKRKAFCEQQQIKVADLKRWDYRLNKLNPKPLLSHANEEIKPSVSFVPVEIASPADATIVNSVQLQHQSGFSLTMSAHTDEQLIKKAIKLLKEAGC